MTVKRSMMKEVLSNERTSGSCLVDHCLNLLLVKAASLQQIPHLLVRKKSMSWSAQSWSSETGAVCGWSIRSQAQALFNCTYDPRVRTLTTHYGRRRNPQIVGSLPVWTSVIHLELTSYYLRLNPAEEWEIALHFLKYTSSLDTV